MNIDKFASEFRDAGFRVFPLYPASLKKGCSCGRDDCEAAFKHPLSSNWQHTPDWSDDQWDTICKYQLKTGYGILCNGLIVVDIDARNGGVESFAKLSRDCPEIAQAGMIVETGSGGGSKHMFFKAPEGVSLVAKLNDYPGLDFKSSGYVVGTGSQHASGNPYRTVIGSPYEIEDAPQAVIDLLKRPNKHRANLNGTYIDVSHADLADMLSHIDPDCEYETWIRAGMAVHHSSAGTGFQVWDEWSAKGSKYNPDKMETHWHSFGRSANPVTLGTLVYYAEEAGWVRPVTFQPEQSEFEIPQIDNDPLDTTGVDLSRPPGFVGEVAEWINQRCRRPRENICVAAALSAIGNIAGLRYTDDPNHGVSLNTFVFCVAGARTGKEAVQQAQTELHRAAGLAPVTHGSIKSEQEITRNIVRHQAALHIIDEFGEFLRKVRNAQERGGASYLEGIIGALMAIYSKHGGHYLVTGDLKEEIKVMLLKEIAQEEKRDEPNEGRIASIAKQLANVDNGIRAPFLSLIGYTTDTKFESLVDFEGATSGFIGRALIFQEPDNAPRKRENYNPPDMPQAIDLMVKRLATGSEFEINAHRVEFYGEKTVIPTDEAGNKALSAASNYFDDMAVEHTGKTGLESLPLGAFELVVKVSLILAVAEGVRTEEHVRWAFALVKRDIEHKMHRVIANDQDKANPKAALRSRIMTLCSTEWKKEGVIILKAKRSYKVEDIKAELAKMVDQGVLECETTQHPINQLESKKYRLTN